MYIYFFFQDGESCLDRLYGGYFPDWSCGGQWQNMIAFLSTLMTNCHHANVHMAIFYNGAIEPTRFADWVKTQMKQKQNVNQVMKHLTKRMTPPPKAFWLPPCSLRTMLRLALRSLRLESCCLLAFSSIQSTKTFEDQLLFSFPTLNDDE